MGKQNLKPGYEIRTVMVPVLTRKFRRQWLRKQQGNNKINDEWQRKNREYSIYGVQKDTQTIIRKLCALSDKIRGKTKKRLLALINRKIADSK